MSSFGHRIYRNRDDLFDAAAHDAILRDTGVVEDDEPTEYSHYVHMETARQAAEGDFTPAERAKIRALLALAPFDPKEE